MRKSGAYKIASPVEWKNDIWLSKWSFRSVASLHALAPGRKADFDNARRTSYDFLRGSSRGLQSARLTHTGTQKQPEKKKRGRAARYPHGVSSFRCIERKNRDNTECSTLGPIALDRRRVKQYGYISRAAHSFKTERCVYSIVRHPFH
ncbi:hypothetical protein MRX96_032180 [Rhipicephalus microplus]